MIPVLLENTSAPRRRSAALGAVRPGV